MSLKMSCHFMLLWKYTSKLVLYYSHITQIPAYFKIPETACSQRSPGFHQAFGVKDIYSEIALLVILLKYKVHHHSVAPDSVDLAITLQVCVVYLFGDLLCLSLVLFPEFTVIPDVS